MADAVRKTQTLVEVLTSTTQVVRKTQTAVEVLVNPVWTMRRTQFLVEVLLGVPVPTMLTITKVTSPVDATAFDFAVTGDAVVTPDTFSLANGDSITYEDITPGTYQIVETIPDGYVQVVTVSNGSPLDALVISPGEHVQVTITNVKPYDIGPCAGWPSDAIAPGDPGNLTTPAWSWGTSCEDA